MKTFIDFDWITIFFKIKDHCLLVQVSRHLTTNLDERSTSTNYADLILISSKSA